MAWLFVQQTDKNLAKFIAHDKVFTEVGHLKDIIVRTFVIQVVGANIFANFFWGRGIE
jgi:hypothetical protein